MLLCRSITKHAFCFLVSVKSGGATSLRNANILLQDLDKGSNLHISQGSGRLLIVPFRAITSRLDFVAFHANHNHWGPLLQLFRPCHTQAQTPTSAAWWAAGDNTSGKRYFLQIQAILP